MLANYHNIPPRSWPAAYLFAAAVFLAITMTLYNGGNAWAVPSFVVFLVMGWEAAYWSVMYAIWLWHTGKAAVYAARAEAARYENAADEAPAAQAQQYPAGKFYDAVSATPPQTRPIVFNGATIGPTDARRYMARVGHDGNLPPISRAASIGLTRDLCEAMSGWLVANGLAMGGAGRQYKLTVTPAEARRAVEQATGTGARAPLIMREESETA